MQCRQWVQSPCEPQSTYHNGLGVSFSMIRGKAACNAAWAPLVGVSPSGKASAFDADIRWFESSHPCHGRWKLLLLWVRTYRQRDNLSGLPIYSTGEYGLAGICGRSLNVRHRWHVGNMGSSPIARSPKISAYRIHNTKARRA